jgi:hypothetical protein
MLSAFTHQHLAMADRQLRMLSIYCALVSVHALGPMLPPGPPSYAMTAAFASLSGLFALAALLRNAVQAALSMPM